MNYVQVLRAINERAREEKLQWTLKILKTHKQPTPPPHLVPSENLRNSLHKPGFNSPGETEQVERRIPAGKQHKSWMTFAMIPRPLQVYVSQYWSITIWEEENKVAAGKA